MICSIKTSCVGWSAGSPRDLTRRIFVNKKIAALTVLAGACFAYGPRAQAQATSKPASSSASDSQKVTDQDIQLLRQDIRSKKKQLIAANLKLTDAEATKFWPVYDQYTAELTKISDEKVALIKEYASEWGTITNEQASSLIKRSLAVDEQVAQLRIKYLPIFSQVVPGKTVATFFQYDRRLQSIIDLQLASQIPVVQDQQ
jgi:hypothetical protein